ncbi:microtubule-associated protein futsch isoform X2 [Wyeomyia smithii]|uniref:microtubule-associated protein futsch isoform X2 n=1 Tax=Wyeomyia smithii TaxID=174621 RepID=UPI002467CCD3|nr:microtubule-associated protein futsch isoform X2 [Wyeomyia smithii]
MPITTPTVPDGLPELMKGLAKSVIKEKPKNIYVHAAEYFESLIRDRDGELDKGYEHFTAHKVYADYREKCRNESGNSSSGSAGQGRSSSSGIQARMASDGDNEESGGSAKAASRGKLKKRLRKQGSKESNKSVDKNEESEEKQSAQKADENIVEEGNGQISGEMVTMSKALSVDAEAVANSVLTVLTEAAVTSDQTDEKTIEGEEKANNLPHPINCEDLSSYPVDENEDAVSEKENEITSAPSTAEAADKEVDEQVDLEEDIVQKENISDSKDALEESEKNEDVSSTNEEKLSENINEKVIVAAKSFSEEAPVDTVDAEEAVEQVTNPESSKEEISDLPNVPIEEPGEPEVEPTSESPAEKTSDQNENQANESDRNAGNVSTDVSNQNDGETLEQVEELAADEPPSDDVPADDDKSAPLESAAGQAEEAENNGKPAGSTENLDLSENIAPESKEELKVEAEQSVDKTDASEAVKENTNDSDEKPVEALLGDGKPNENISTLDEPGSDPLLQQQGEQSGSGEEIPADSEQTINKPAENASNESENSPQKPDEPVLDEVLPKSSTPKESSEEKSESEINASEQSEGISKESAKESEADGSELPEGELSVNSADQLEQEEEQSLEKDSNAAVVGEPVEHSASVENDVAGNENADNTEPESGQSSSLKSEKVEETPVEAQENEVNSSDEKLDDAVESQEEVVEEPCIQREVPSSESRPGSKTHSAELEEIKKVDLASFDKNSAEALFYSLKKTELENTERPQQSSIAQLESVEKDDDADVVITEETPTDTRREQTKRAFTDDFLEDGPITKEPDESGSSGGVNDANVDIFNPMEAATSRNQQLLDQMHHIKDDSSLPENHRQKIPIRRSMTENVDLSRQNSNYVDLRKYDPDYVEDEDQFDGYYIGNIRNKILASSTSVADSDYSEPDREVAPIDDNNVQTALETIMSTDTESTLASQTTVHANRGVLRKGSQTNIPYASFGNSAIDRSLDEFIEREEQHKEAEAQAASTIQRSYRQFRSNKRKLLRDYHSTMRTFTEDHSTESLEDYSGVIQVKVDQKNPEKGFDSNENGRPESLRRPMLSLNIDETDTVARRTTLTRGTAVQRNSTRDDESARSDPASTEKKASNEPTSTPSDLSADKKPNSDEKENKDSGSPNSS